MQQENRDGRARVKIQQIDQLISQRKFKSLVKYYKAKGDRDLYQEYQQVRFKGNVLNVGQHVMMQENETNEETFAALIRKIVCIRDPQSTYVPLLKVQWYGSREDVILPDKFRECVSDNELFLSTLAEYKPVDYIVRPIRVLTFQEYESLQWEEEFLYFSRAGFNHLTYLVNPPFQKWGKTCLCQMPVNPDLKYILCDRCKEWYHLRCVGLNEEEEEQPSNFRCPQCK